MTSEADEKILLEVCSAFDDRGRKALLIDTLQRLIMTMLRI
jgi:hypothetical protein